MITDDNHEYSEHMKRFCEEEGVSESCFVKTLSRAQVKFQTRLFIMNEMTRLRAKYGPGVSDDDIDDEVSEALAYRIANDIPLVDTDDFLLDEKDSYHGPSTNQFESSTQDVI